MFTRHTAARPLKSRNMEGRRLILVDVENVNGGAVMTSSEARATRRAVCAAVGPRHGDHLVVSTSHVGFLATASAWSDARLLIRSGPDGADLALLGILQEEEIADRFREVVLVSGDGIFTGEVRRLTSAGVTVTAVAYARGCSKRLRMAATRTQYLDLNSPRRAA